MKKMAILFVSAVIPMLAVGQTTLDWDPGTSQTGTTAFAVSNTNAGLHLFEVTTTNTAANAGYWRTVLNVAGGEADLYISTSAAITTNSFIEKSDTAGSDRIVRSFVNGQTWYLLVAAESNSTWSIFAGDMHVVDLGWDPGTQQGGTDVHTQTNTSAEADSFLYRVTTTNTAASLGCWRTVLEVTGGEADLYIDPGANVATNANQYYSEEPGGDTIVQPLTAGQTKYILVEAEAGASWRVFAGDIHLTELTWDPGTADAGTEVFTNLHTAGGAYYFKLTTENAGLQAWRTALDVITGEADLYMEQNDLPFVNSSGQSFHDSSTYTGDDGVTRYLSNTTGAGQEWYFLVQAATGSTWNLLSGDAYAEDLGALATNSASGSGAAVVPPEGIRYFKTTIPVETLAWRLWLQDATGTTTWNEDFYVRHGLAPHPSSTSYYDKMRNGQGLLVPDYLVPGDPTYYYVGIPGEPGDAFQLDSRQQEVTSTPYNNTLVGQSATGFLFKTYSIAVPSEQIALEVTAEPTAGTNPDLAVRFNKVPNAFNNDAISEVAGSTTSDSITLVPPKLTDGTYYVTVHGDAAISFNLRNREPVITQIDYNSTSTNDAPNRAGWRYYAVSDIGQQLGQLGWLLELADHVPGSEIAIRRNFVPGRWHYRANGSTSTSESSYNDQSSVAGFLQEPEHAADVWYIGIYTPDTNLGDFILTSGAHVPTEVSLGGHTNAAVSLVPRRWHFYHLDVPAQTNGNDVLGWELRMTSWASERPYMNIRRDQLPDRTSTSSGWYPWKQTQWLSGKQWVNRNNDWSGYRYDPVGHEYPQPLIAMGMGAPLEPGSYYIGFFNNSSTVTGSYSFTSSTIGSNLTYQPATVPFNGGSAAVTNLPGRAVEYFHVNVPSNTPSWKVRLENTVGETRLYVREGWVPTWGMGGGANTSPGASFSSMAQLQKTGDEHFVLLPESGETTIPAGDYYLMVVGEGRDPSGNYIGTNTSSAVLHSLGEATSTDLGTLPLVGSIVQANSYGAGEVDLLHFDVPTNVLSMQLRLESTTGSPRMYLRSDGFHPKGPVYGLYAGRAAEQYNDQVITVPNPAAGTYALTIGHYGGDPAAGSYTLRIEALGASEFAVDGYTNAPAVLPPRQWHYYHVDVPAQTNRQDIIGWELRTTSWSGQRPYMSIRRDIAPTYPAPSWYYPHTSATWPSGNEWLTTGGDWSGYQYGNGGQQYPQYLLSMGMGAPLEPGSYYIGFYNPSTTTTGTYSFASSAIGTGMVYEPQTIAFNGGFLPVGPLDPRGVAYYKVNVPSNSASWHVQLQNGVGETRLYIREANVPTWGMGGGANSSPGKSFSTMAQLQKTGDEHFVLLPESGETTIPAGDYYLMVVGEGQDPSGSTIGTNSSTAFLYSYGEAAVNDLGTLPGAGTVTDTNSYAAGEVRLYRFEVPLGALSMELRLGNVVGSPEMNLRLDGNMPNGAGYGSYSGYANNHNSQTVITVPNPVPGTHTLMVNDSRPAASIEAGSYVLEIETAGTTDIAMDGGGQPGVVLPPKTWEYYKIEVPSQIAAQDVIGWEVRATNWSGYRPNMVIRRGELPSGTGTSWYYPRTTTSWQSGWQWGTVGSDWAGYTYDPTGTIQHPEYLLSMGMGAPLEPGTYYLGFYNNSASVTSTVGFVSRAIGNGMGYDPQPIAFSGGNGTVSNLEAHGVAYFEVDVPSNTANWKVELENTSGETKLYIREAHVPTWTMISGANRSPGASFPYMTELQKPGNEHFVLTPESGESTIPPGTYYLMVVSEGQNPSGNRIGSGTASAVLTSIGEVAVPSLGNLGAGGTLSTSNSYEAGEVDLMRFGVQAGVSAVEVRLDHVVGDPEMYLRTDASMPNGIAYGLYSGNNDRYFDRTIITVPNPAPGTFSVVVGDRNSTGLVDGSYDIIVTDLLPPDLNFDAALNTNGNSNVASGILADDQRDFYRVEVPATLGGEPVAGWYLTATVATGDAQIRVRQDQLPADGVSLQTPFDSLAQVVVPPFLTPGTWYVEIKGVGATDYTLTSSAVAMQREWTMPAVGGTNTTPGVADPLFGDSGVDEFGAPLPIDQGVDLDKGLYHFYAVEVPADNAGLLRTQLEAISGNPNLYIRAGDVPTLDHGENGSGNLYDRYLNSTANTEYGNWVPYDGRYASALEPGTWYIMVKAEGTGNARYRLKLSGGNVYAGGNVQDLALTNGSYSAQLLAANDWRHYRVEIPTNAPVNWDITYAQASGNVDLFIRDTVPAGNWNYFSSTASAVRDWNYDQKNRGTARPNFPDTGTHTVNVPPLRPGHTYYLSFVAKADASFSVSSAVSGGTMPAYEKVDFSTGFVSTNIPASSSITYQVDVPPDAVRWIHSNTNSSALDVYLEQGSLPSLNSLDHWRTTAGNGSLNKYLLNTATDWPWRPGYTYYFTVVNPTASPEPFILVMNGSLASEIPQNLSATDGTYADHVRVSWGPVSGAGSYEVWRNTVDDKATATNLATSGSTVYFDYSAVPGQLYHYWVSVGGVTNTSWFSTGDTGWVPGIGTIAPMQRVHTAAGGTGTVAVTVPGGTVWNATESLNWVSINSGSPATNSGSVGYTVSEYAGATARTGTVTVAGQPFLVVQEPLGLPANVQATDGTYEDRTDVTWDDVVGVDRYYIYRNVASNTVGASSLGYVTTNIYHDISAVVDQVYYYWVRPYNGGGYGGYSLPDTGFRYGGVIPASWKTDYFPGGYPGDAVDSDGDGFSNIEEFIADTNPTNGLSFFRIENQYGVPAGFVVEWTSVSGRVYGVNWIGSLTNSMGVLTNGIPYPQSSYTDSVHSAEGGGFYNLEVELQ